MDSAPKPTKVLVVEDEESFLEALRIGLGREGFAIDVARDGVEALHASSDLRYRRLPRNPDKE